MADKRFTQQDFENAIIKDNKHYLTLDNPNFEGQTRPNSEGHYLMYWSHEGVLYGYKFTLEW